MNKFKISLILTICVIFSACAIDASSDGGDSTVKIVATNFPAYDFARQITAEHAELAMLLPPGGDSHSFEPTAQQIIEIQNSDLFIYTGGEGDSWIEGILDSMGERAPRTLQMMECVSTVEEEYVAGMEHDEHDHNDHHDEDFTLDEHVWTSPKNAISIVQSIADALVEIDSGNKDEYTRNKQEYVAKLSELDEAYRKVVGEADRNVLLFGDRFPFRYLTDEYGLRYFAAFPGCSTETDASASTIAFLIEKAKAEKIPIILKIELTSDKIAKTIADASDSKVDTLHSCHGVTKEELKSGATYLSLMSQNLDVLAAALK